MGIIFKMYLMCFVLLIIDRGLDLMSSPLPAHNISSPHDPIPGISPSQLATSLDT
ncbi:hypothetical protein BO71DRAFT_78280 [Aspergillus ellipticus CBS 707.79]|uniref:Uncharacterized protein n=1 Tax=Aspergillus ellipticus CBS 707.79 TaxID=1448320 RepID=A0A319F0T2_9EURO|nr:hypothetical protein BO71DRAFT_78280 [Aspergillus ellipticus CBS 707.79]